VRLKATFRKKYAGKKSLKISAEKKKEKRNKFQVNSKKAYRLVSS